jgi:LmbE family N-acetylglucosaminyl deacetylase
MMTRRAMLTGLATIISIGADSSMVDAIPRPPAIWLSPHSDDLLLSMGVSAVEHLQAGRKCIFVLLTQGSSQGTLDKIAAKAGIPLTSEQISIARIKEMADEVSVYNTIGSGSMMINNYRDGTLQINQVKSVVRLLEAQYPGADYKTMTHLDSHPDHAASGKAIQQMRADYEIKTAPRYYVKDYDRARVSSTIPVFGPLTADATRQAIVNRASEAYKIWNPAIGRFSVGYLSVTSSFNELNAKAVNIIHG